MDRSTDIYIKPPHPRPPLGITPRYIVDQMRMNEIEAAVLRFLQAGKVPRAEWVEEYRELYLRSK